MNEWIAVALLGIPVGGLAGLALAVWLHFKPGGVRAQIRAYRDVELP